MRTPSSLAAAAAFASLFAAASASAQSPGIDTTAQSEIVQVAVSMMMIAVVIGVVYNLWKSTRTYGGIIGQGIRRVGFGMLFLVIEALDRVSIHFSSTGLIDGLTPPEYGVLVHDALYLLGLLFVTLGFMKFSKALKT